MFKKVLRFCVPFCVFLFFVSCSTQIIEKSSISFSLSKNAMRAVTSEATGDWTLTVTLSGDISGEKTFSLTSVSSENQQFTEQRFTIEDLDADSTVQVEASISCNNVVYYQTESAVTVNLTNGENEVSLTLKKVASNSDDEEQKTDEEQKSDDEDQKTDEEQKSDDGEQTTDEENQKTDDDEQKSDDEDQKTDDEEQKTDDNTETDNNETTDDTEETTELVITVAKKSEVAVTASAGETSYTSGNALPYTSEITFALDDDTSYDSYIWYLNGNQLDSTAKTVSITPAKSDYVVLSTSTESNVNTLECFYKADGTYYVAEFNFTTTE